MKGCQRCFESRVEHANSEKLLQDFQKNAKIVQSLLAVKASTNIFPQNLFPTKTGVNTVRGPHLSSEAQKHLRVQWIKDMGQLLHVEKTSCCKPQPQTTLQKKTASYILSLQAYYDSTTIHFSVISSSECKQFWRNRTSWVCPGQYFYLLSVIHLIFLVIIFILLFFFLLCPLFLIVFPFSSIILVYQNSDKTDPADVVRVPRDVHISYNIALILHLFSGFFFSHILFCLLLFFLFSYVQI